MTERALSTLIAALAGCATPLPAPPDAPPATALSLAIDNDSYSLDDGNYTNGAALVWVSPTAERLPQRGLDGWIAHELAPLVGGRDEERRVVLSGRHMTFTPEKLQLDDPPPDARPYAGVVLFDATLLAQTDDSLVSTSLRLGWVGEATLAEELQRELHGTFGAKDPKGWEHQLDNEPVLGIGFDRRARLSKGTLAGNTSYDLTRSFGLGLGTYFTGIGLGLELRLASSELSEIGGRPVRSSSLGYESPPTFVPPRGAALPAHFLVGVEGYWVGHYLPLDGGVFEDGRSTEPEDFVGAGRLGYVLGAGPYAFALSYTLVSDAYETQRKPGQYGTISITWRH